MNKAFKENIHVIILGVVLGFMGLAIYSVDVRISQIQSLQTDRTSRFDRIESGVSQINQKLSELTDYK